MRITEAFSLRMQPSASDAPPRSALLQHGEATGREIDAAVLEAAVEVQQGFLLFTTDDVPSEEALGIHLLDADLNPVDHATLGAAYSTGSFSDLRLEPPGSVRFRFIGDTVWRVRLLDKPVLRTPFNAEPAGVHRRFGLHRHFTIEGRPRPA